MKKLILFVFLLPLLFSCEQEKPQPPNIVFIMSDDHAFQAVSAYGHGLNNTPNIDRIAQEGALFNKGFVTNSICAPSRAVMLTGKHSFVNGKVDNVQDFNWEQPNFAKNLQDAGYQTAMIGKIHLRGLPQGFDYSAVLPGQGHYYNPDFIINGVKERIQGYVTSITTRLSLDWLKNKRDKTKPFLLLYHQKAPHRNWQSEEKYLTLFDDKNFDFPDNFFDDYEGRPAAAAQEMLTPLPKSKFPPHMAMVDTVAGDTILNFSLIPWAEKPNSTKNSNVLLPNNVRLGSMPIRPKTMP